MNLIIDLGNTYAKLAVYDDNGDMVEYFYHHGLSLDDLKNFISNHLQIKASILSSVIDNDATIINFLKHEMKCLFLDEHTPLPLKNKYKSPDTLGKDRLADAVGAYTLFPDKNCLVIDAGTCIKYDIITAAGEYLGGAISPGLMMRFKALNTFTDKLPLIQAENNFNQLIGSTTQESILLGVQEGVALETKGFIEKYKEIYPNLVIILTGGDTNFLDKAVKNDIFVEPFLILKGLNAILNFNKNL